jgi:hypothetical protein
MLEEKLFQGFFPSFIEDLVLSYNDSKYQSLERQFTIYYQLLKASNKRQPLLSLFQVFILIARRE